MVTGHISSSAFSIYECGEIMIGASYYIQWLPSYISSGSFYFDPYTYYYRNYTSGYFDNFNGTITSSAFYQGTFSSIETNAKIIEAYAFNYCSNLENVSLPECNSIGFQGFGMCNKLHIIDLPECEYIHSQAFVVNAGHDYGLNTITLGGSNVCMLFDKNAFNGTKITSTTGFICVPSSLVSYYQVASEWSYFFNRIFPIGSKPYYIQWTPSYISSGTFRTNAVAYAYSSYSSGRFETYDSFIGRSFYSQGFRNNTEITTIETNVLTVYDEAFESCTALTSVSLSQVTYIWRSAFNSCTSLTYVNLPACSYLNGSVFYGCTNLVSVNLPVLESTYNTVFAYCSSLQEISLPMCTYIATGVFADCINLESVYLPVCSYLGYNAFTGCSKLSDVYLPSVLELSGRAFALCSLLSNIDLPVCNIIRQSAFWKAGLQTITLRNSSICILSSTDAFYSCPISGIFVPSDLVAGYQISTNWSVFASIIFPISS